LQLGLEVAVHDLNLKPRPCLEGVSARHCFEVGYVDKNMIRAGKVDHLRQWRSMFENARKVQGQVKAARFLLRVCADLSTLIFRVDPDPPLIFRVDPDPPLIRPFNPIPSIYNPYFAV